MRRRDFALVGAAAASPLTAAEQLPVIGFLHSDSPEQNVRRTAGFHKG